MAEGQADENPKEQSAVMQFETKQLVELQDSRNELLSRVANLKKDLQDWRTKLDDQVKNYRNELGDLRSTLNDEVEQLRTEFQGLRSTLQQQLEATANLASVDDDDSEDQQNK